MYKTILLSYDGSDHAQNALVAATSIAKAMGADLHVAHTPQPEIPPVVIGSFVAPLEHPLTKEQVAEAGELVAGEARQKAEAGGVKITEAHIGGRDPAVHTLDVANKIGADLIVMGRRGMGSFTALVLGSVSQSITHGAKCACLTVV